MSEVDSYLALAVALGLGLLVGLQRQWKESDIAGIRTFPLITLSGALSVIVSGGSVGWLSTAGLIGLAVLMLAANLAKMYAGEREFGMTTEVGALLMFLVGCALGAGLTGPAVVTAGVAAVLLHWKARLHDLVESLSARDLTAVMNLVLIALVILPLLPDRTYGPYDVLNPHDIWRMVVLIVGISMVAYIAFQLLGARVGSILGGILGGLISSTATTVSYARQTRQTNGLDGLAAMVIVIASAIVNVRVLVEIGVAAPALLQAAAGPIGAMLLLMVIESVVLYALVHKTADQPPLHDNPAQLKPAIVFGALYAIILFIVAAAKDLFGERALYGVACISGLTDVDAITLSTARMFNEQRIEVGTAWRVILIATMSNLVFKAGAVALLGSRRLLLYVAVAFATALVGGALLLIVWPDTFPAEMLNSRSSNLEL